ncbi:Uma2 family endonuclease [Thauera sp.]|uniref:Uma2 family endonuclease n=1 Tax=Thauera sp. TaxID=1905334 RepID=UPI001B5644D5|nr:Uma2 family endonuclease [Thauera sp.]MBP6131334.1 Uma2 family endonuclease [Thauera sp.]MBP7047326.1 Uma2 family endonuclease [Thauera sp.]
MGLALRKEKRCTYADYLQWPEDTRYELIDGEAFLMSPAPLVEHQEVAGEVYRQLANQLDGKPCRPFIAPVDVRLPRKDETDAAIDTVVQPDVLVVCDPSKIDRRGVRGAPDWLLEVLSPSTAAHDQIAKRRTYERAGVREYWLVHPGDRTLTVYVLDNGQYGRPEIYELKDATPVGVLPGVSIAWDALVERLPKPEY